MLHLFTDPVLAAPSIGCMLMCFVAALIGTFSVLRRQSLVGETLSHACYPGVIAVSLLSIMFFPMENELLSFFIPLLGASLSSILGMWLVNVLQRQFRVSADAALCVVLASFFGIGITLVSSLQMSYPTLYRQLQSYLFGQAATMTQFHVIIYTILTICVLAVLAVFYRQIKLVIFDPQFAEIAGVNVVSIHFLLMILVVTAVCIGIRSVGVVLMSAMLIFPAVSARQWTNRLRPLLVIGALFGMMSGFFGVYLSHTMSYLWIQDGRFTSFPTGPMIVIVASAIFFFSSFFAPKSGLFVRAWRRMSFWIRCQEENFLKMLWKNGEQFTKEQMQALFHTHPILLRLLITALVLKGWLKRVNKDVYKLTALGRLWGRKIVRLHRLWEVYLVECCGVAKERVHPSAEEMEHIITPEIERELTCILHDPVQDPHKQPIPPN